MNIDPSTKHGYDIACGFRGPDHKEPGYISEDRTVKWVLTARIRGIVGASPSYGAVRISPSILAPQSSVHHTFNKFAKEVPNVTRHYLYHAMYAFRALCALTEDEACKKEVSLLRRLAESADNYNYHHQRGQTRAASRCIETMRYLWGELFEAEATDED